MRSVSFAYLKDDVHKSGREKWDWANCQAPTVVQRKMLMAKMISEAVGAMMSNHIYQFDGKVYRQLGGGPIGLELTGVIADLVMNWFDERFKRLSQDAGLNIVM